jgi:hypothetical protein
MLGCCSRVVYVVCLPYDCFIFMPESAVVRFESMALRLAATREVSDNDRPVHASRLFESMFSFVVLRSCLHILDVLRLRTAQQQNKTVMDQVRDNITACRARAVM